MGAAAPGLQSSGEDVLYFVNCAFEKIWIALTPEKFSHFTQLASLLSYLKMCMHSVIVDHNRLQEQADLSVYEEGAAFERKVKRIPWRTAFLARLIGIGSGIDQYRLNDHKERRVILAFVLALSQGNYMNIILGTLIVWTKFT